MANCLPSLMPIEWYVEQHELKEYSRMKIKDSANHSIGKLNHNVNANGQSVKERKPTHAKSKEGSKASAANGKKQTDITRCNIRERVIQMLAVKPFKRLELYTHLQNEGLRDSERSVIGTVLRDVALFRDNVYILQHFMWNNVKDDWPFYSEQERQQLQINKQQNLSPPVSSDAASSTSGQGPPSRNSSSQPQLATDYDSNGGNDLKRPNEEYYDPVPSKKRRISHLLKKEHVEIHMNANNANTLVQHRNVHDIKDGEECSGIIDCVTNTNKTPTELKNKPEVTVSHQDESQTKTDLSESSKKHIQQESKHISDHPNHQEEDSRSADSSSSESSDDSSDSSSESDDSSDSESSDDYSESL